MTIAVMGRDEMKHIEMIIDYIVDGEDFQYNDNHGVLIRCRDCKYRLNHYCHHEDTYGLYVHMDGYCSRGERRDE